MPEDRSKDRHKFRASIADVGDLWKEFGQLVGDGNRSKVIRQFIAAMLGRPGVRMPRRRDYPPKG